MDAVRGAARAHGVRRCVTLPVSCAFHSRLMRAAQPAMRAALAQVPLASLAMDAGPGLVANVTATEVRDAEAIRELLVEHVSAPVRWADSVRYCRDNAVTRCASGGAPASHPARFHNDKHHRHIAHPGL
jgi:malonyl CoA-acyl carrier protein transacylase